MAIAAAAPPEGTSHTPSPIASNAQIEFMTAVALKEIIVRRAAAGLAAIWISAVAAPRAAGSSPPRNDEPKTAEMNHGAPSATIPAMAMLAAAEKNPARPRTYPGPPYSGFDSSAIIE